MIQLVVSERQEHSRKSDIIYEHIEKMLKDPYIELFGFVENERLD